MERRFRLAGLLRLRKLQEEQAAAELGRANGRREREQSRSRKARRDLADHAFEPGAELPAWRATVAARSALRQNVQLASAAVVSAQQEVTEREAEWNQTRVRAVPLEKLEEKHAERVAFEDLRVEQIQLDEAATRRATTTSDDTLGEPR